MRSYASEPEIKTRDMWIDYTRNMGREAEIDFHTKAWFSEPLFFSSLLCVRGGCMGILEEKSSSFAELYVNIYSRNISCRWNIRLSQAEYAERKKTVRMVS